MTIFRFQVFSDLQIISWFTVRRENSPDSLSTTLPSVSWESPFMIEGRFTTRPPSLTTTLSHKLMKNSNGLMEAGL